MKQAEDTQEEEARPSVAIVKELGIDIDYQAALAAIKNKNYSKTDVLRDVSKTPERVVDPVEDQKQAEEKKEQDEKTEKTVKTAYGEGSVTNIREDGFCEVKLDFGVVYIQEKKNKMKRQKRQ